MDKVNGADVGLFADACNAALAYQQPIDVVVKLESLSIEVLQEMLHVLETGKQQNDIKVKMLVEKLPELKIIATAQMKITGSYDEAVVKACSSVWENVLTQSGGSKFNMDILKMMMKQIIKAKSGATMAD